jgi:hypothetical protein
MSIFRFLKQHIYDPPRQAVKRLKEHIAYVYFLIKGNHVKYGQPKNQKKGTKVLFVGSGKSALEYKNHEIDQVEVLTVNNSHLAFDDFVAYYLCSTDFPKKRKPNREKYGELILKPKYFYDVLSHARYHKLPFRPQVGKTIFLDGLYWAMTKGFSEIYLLGFDHDYNPKRVEKWDGKHIGNEEKLKEIFSSDDESPDAFYGQNTPDPLRHGKHNLSQMFMDAHKHAAHYGCTIYNLSSRKGGIEVFERTTHIKK